MSKDTSTPSLDDDLGLTDDEFAIADRIEAVMKRSGNGITTSFAARAVKVDYTKAYKVLDYLVEHQYVHTTGNGARTHYHWGRA
jgi:hypothetical protein